MNPRLDVFTDGQYDVTRLEEIYSINQKNIPAVGALESVDKLKELLSINSYHSVLLLNNTVIGFTICFREKTIYWSENYKYFTNHLKKFLYIDRVAIDENYRRKGFGKILYEDIFLNTQQEVLSITAEVNTKPINQASLSFHTHMGFKQIGKRDFDDHNVAYFIK